MIIPPHIAVLAHLPAGVRAHRTSDRTVAIKPSLLGQDSAFALDQSADAFAFLSKNVSAPIGLELFTTNDQERGIYPPTWQPIHASAFVIDAAYQQWRGVANNAHQQDDYELFDKASRIAFALLSSSLRLRDLSNAYNAELAAFIKKEDFKVGNRSKTLNTFHIIIGLHAFFSEAASLRDYLGEFLYRYGFSEHDPNRANIRLMAKLLKRLRIIDSRSQPIAEQLSAIGAEPAGWLARFSAYRDLFVHYAPASHLIPGGFVTKISLDTPGGLQLPGIKVPLPEDPFALKRLLSAGPAHKTVDHWLNAIKSAREPSAGIDGLDYCHSMLGKFGDLALQVATYSPRVARGVHIGPSDLIGPVTISTD